MMRTQTHIYLDHDVEALPLTFDRTEETGWSVRSVLILEPISEVKKELPTGSARQMVKIISLLVVYEREETHVRTR